MKTLIDAAHAKGMKVFFDIITNHTADVIDYKEGQYTYKSKKSSPYEDAVGTAFDDRDYVNKPFPRDGARRRPSPTPRSSTRRRRHREDAGLAQRPADVPQPRRLDLRRRVLDLRRLLRSRRPVHRAPRGRRGDGRHLQDLGRLRHRRLPHRHRQARQPRVLAEVRARHPRRGRAASRTTTSSPSARSTTATRRSCRSTRPRASCRPPSTSASSSRGSTSPRASRPRCWPTSSAKDDWYTDADSNAYQLPTFLGNHDMGRASMFLKARRAERGRAPQAGEVRRLADVHLTRQPGHLLRRRAGLRQHRRRPGRPRGHVREQGRPLQHRGRPRRARGVDGPLQHRAPALPAHRRAVGPARAEPGARRRRPGEPLRRRRCRHLRHLADRRRHQGRQERRQGRVRRGRQQRHQARDGRPSRPGPRATARSSRRSSAPTRPSSRAPTGR